MTKSVGFFGRADLLEMGIISSRQRRPTPDYFFFFFFFFFSFTDYLREEGRSGDSKQPIERGLCNVGHFPCRDEGGFCFLFAIYSFNYNLSCRATEISKLKGSCG